MSISSVFNSPRSISGESYQNVADFDFDHVAHDEPFQFRRAPFVGTASLRADRRILAHHEHAFHFPVGHVVEIFEERMIAGDLRDPVVAEVVFGVARSCRSRP